jgi:predicted AlkP superfamily pyrophosphatase or phosphodiesterase
VIAVDDYIDITGLEIVTTSPILGINVPEGRRNDVVRRLDAAPNLSAWAKSDLPSRFSYGEHPRIPDVIALADDGWTIYRTREYMMERLSTLRGSTHGYDPAELSMRALFIADGPAFRDRVSIDPFECVHIYEMLAQVLDVTPAENDGDPDILAPILER